MILLLEDDPDRLARFSNVLTQFQPQLEWMSWRSVPQMMLEARPYIPGANLISLDHDLDPWDGDTDDPGDGVQLVKWLVQWKQPCPVIIHSSNRERSDWMAGELELEQWTYRRVAPIGDDWIEAYWIRVVSKLLNRKTRKKKRK